MSNITVNKWQWVLDAAFGIGLLLPILYIAFVSYDPRLIGISIGVSFGYVIHVTQKVLIFDEMLKESVKEEAQDRVKKEAKDTVEREAKEKVEKYADKKIQ